MTNQAGNALRGVLFFSLFWPSFTRLGFEARRRWWDTSQPDLSGQTWLVTGASAGIGREIALAAARSGARVIAAARRADALDDLAMQSGGAIEPRATDLSQMGAVLDLAASLPRVDVLINNVDVMFNRPQTTVDGLDAGFATNLLGHYLLTEEMIDHDRLAAGAGVVTMTSGGAYNVPLTLEPLIDMRPYEGTLAYAYQKRAQIALNGYWRQHYESRFRFYVTHPGWVETPGVAEAMPLFRMTFAALLRTPRQGADTALWLGATRPVSRRADSVWFDRAEYPAHLLPGTRQGAATGDLIGLLDDHKARVADRSGAPAMPIPR
ncbi:MAG: SDR family NAD(P)-dependent oxidoreductase [Pseudomonadales bacterium]